MQIAKWVEERKLAQSVVVVASIGLLSLWTGRPLAANQHLIRMADWILTYSVYYQHRITIAVDAKDWKRAGSWYVEFFRQYEPSDAEIATASDPGLMPELVDMHVECAQILKLAGEGDQSATEMKRAADLQRLK